MVVLRGGYASSNLEHRSRNHLSRLAHRIRPSCSDAPVHQLQCSPRPTHSALSSSSSASTASRNDSFVARSLSKKPFTRRRVQFHDETPLRFRVGDVGRKNRVKEIYRVVRGSVAFIACTISDSTFDARANQERFDVRARISLVS